MTQRQSSLRRTICFNQSAGLNALGSPTLQVFGSTGMCLQVAIPLPLSADRSIARFFRAKISRLRL
jgi:hypothetical protein